MSAEGKTLGKVFRVFSKELALIQSKDIREYVLAVFAALTPEHFWQIPASTSGKYHPTLASGSGGLVRHVRYAIWWATELMRRWEHPVDGSNDIVVAALLLHDLWKNGEKNLQPVFCNPEINLPTWPKGPEGITGEHGTMLGDRLLAGTRYAAGPTESIAICVAEHMGKWTTRRWIYPHSETVDQVVETVQLADYCSGRRAEDFS